MVRDRRLSLTASTSASTSRSLHTDRRICYLVFATTALASSLLAHAPLSLSLFFCIPILRTESAPPFLFPSRTEGIWSTSLLLANSFPRKFEGSWRKLEFREKELPPFLRFFLPLFPHLPREQRNERVPPLVSPEGNTLGKIQISARIVFLFFSLQTAFFSLSLLRKEKQSRSIEGERSNDRLFVCFNPRRERERERHESTSERKCKKMARYRSRRSFLGSASCRSTPFIHYPTAFPPVTAPLCPHRQPNDAN